jgi:hypothetical protein
MGMGVRFSPRRMELDDLVKVLVEEHVIMRDGLRRAEEARQRRDFATVGRILREIEPVFRQHVADEEAQVLGLLIREVGVEGAKEEIRVLQQHRPIFQLMKKVGELAAMSSSELEENQNQLDVLFSEHTKAEEERVFPRTLKLSGSQVDR